MIVYRCIYKVHIYIYASMYIICIYGYETIYVYIYIYACACVSIYTYIYRYLSLFICLYVNVWKDNYPPVPTPPCQHSWIHNKYLSMCLSIYVSMFECTYWVLLWQVKQCSFLYLLFILRLHSIPCHTSSSFPDFCCMGNFRPKLSCVICFLEAQPVKLPTCVLSSVQRNLCFPWVCIACHCALWSVKRPPKNSRKA